MSMDTCKVCGTLVNTDDYPDDYLVTLATMDRPAHMQDHECVCEHCQNRMPEALLEARLPQ